MHRNDDPPNWMLEDPPCEVCKKDPFDCICPACPDCGVNGDPKCYKEHSLKLIMDNQFNTIGIVEEYPSEEQVVGSTIIIRRLVGKTIRFQHDHSVDLVALHNNWRLVNGIVEEKEDDVLQEYSRNLYK